MILSEIHKNQLNKLCQKFHVAQLYIFGSAAQNALKAESDVDLLVKFESFDLYYYFDNYINFRNELEKLFSRKVDLVEEQSLKNPILKASINKDKKLIYG
ncbi:nucleotidyltransferase family protein [Aequorivita echinoideorum]|uniref:Nucleotidyltransferase domain-containing protein n=1 Tax=Aequorivita echinoideorum TaxID=1549647 RepID=A0ABS5S3Q8_9FLAO|nr:nucleotidyltransferase domain-containing protein [Aequorivita echinoideorum]MBT0607847.1 nucleotidyltransferase domain-containing protein [Aequorivita echinoideorum]